MRAVIWTDVFQFVVMIGGMLAILIKVHLNNFLKTKHLHEMTMIMLLLLVLTMMMMMFTRTSLVKHCKCVILGNFLTLGLDN